MLQTRGLVAAHPMAHITVQYSIQYEDRTWRVPAAELMKAADECTTLVRISSHGFARLCFAGASPVKWCHRSEGMALLLKCRNESAFKALTSEASVFAQPTPAKAAKRPRLNHTEMKAKRDLRDTMSVRLPCIDLPGGISVEACHATMLRPIQPTDAPYVELTPTNVDYICAVISQLGLQELQDGDAEELPKGTYKLKSRFVFRWFYLGRWRHKTFPFEAESSRAAAKGKLFEFAANPNGGGALVDPLADEVSEDDAAGEEDGVNNDADVD